MAEGNGLLNRRRDKISTEGSNPSLSANRIDTGHAYTGGSCAVPECLHSVVCRHDHLKISVVPCGTVSYGSNPTISSSS